MATRPWLSLYISLARKNLAFSASVVNISHERLKNLLLRHLRLAEFVPAERAKFKTLFRMQKQSVGNFILTPRTPASKCNCSPQLDGWLRDHVIVGINVRTSANSNASSSSYFSERAKYPRQHREIPTISFAFQNETHFPFLTLSIDIVRLKMPLKRKICSKNYFPGHKRLTVSRRRFSSGT